MFEIYTFFENRTEIRTFFENRIEICILFENRFEIYIYILFENRTEISNILSMADEVTISKHEYPKVLFTWRWSLFLGNNDVVFSLNGYPQETKATVEASLTGPGINGTPKLFTKRPSHSSM